MGNNYSMIDMDEKELTEEQSYEDYLKDLSVDELKNEISDLRNTISYIHDLIDTKEAETYPYAGNYIKVYEVGGEPEYIKCETCRVIKDHPGRSGLQLYFKGIGFSSDFGPYDDSNFSHFTTWDDHYLRLDDFLCYEKQRKSGKIKKGQHGWNNYRVEIITKDEYINAFNDMLKNMKSTLIKWIE